MNKSHEEKYELVTKTYVKTAKFLNEKELIDISYIALIFMAASMKILKEEKGDQLLDDLVENTLSMVKKPVKFYERKIQFL